MENEQNGTLKDGSVYVVIMLQRFQRLSEVVYCL